MSTRDLRPRERTALLQALRAGVTPRLGASHIQVGRDAEIAALNRDLDSIASGGAGFRLIVGDFGSGKTFFLNLIRGEALERQLVTVHADLNPGRRLHASGGEARKTARQPEDIIHERLAQLSVTPRRKPLRPQRPGRLDRPPIPTSPCSPKPASPPS